LQLQHPSPSRPCSLACLPTPTPSTLPQPAGGCNYQAAVDYITKLFHDRNDTSGKRKIFTKVTCATDKSNVKTVFNSCKATILEMNMRGSGFMDP
jgi:hypothetical protein